MTNDISTTGGSGPERANRVLRQRENKPMVDLGVALQIAQILGSSEVSDVTVDIRDRSIFSITHPNFTIKLYTAGNWLTDRFGEYVHDAVEIEPILKSPVPRMELIGLNRIEVPVDRAQEVWFIARGTSHEFRLQVNGLDGSIFPRYRINDYGLMEHGLHLRFAEEQGSWKDPFRK